MNTLAVFGITATLSITLIIGFLIGMCWVEQRVFSQASGRWRARVPRAPRRSRAALVSATLALAALVAMSLRSGSGTPQVIERLRRSAVARISTTKWTGLARVVRVRLTGCGNRGNRIRARPRS